MSDFEDMSDHDGRAREERDGEYYLVTGKGSGRISCYRPGMVLLDFYRTSPILVKDIPPTKPKEEPK